MKFPSVADSQGNLHPLTNGSYISLMESPDRTLRENAFKAYYAVYSSSRNALAGRKSRSESPRGWPPAPDPQKRRRRSAG